MTRDARHHDLRSAVVLTAVLAGLVVGTLSASAAVSTASGGDVVDVAPIIDDEAGATRMASPVTADSDDTAGNHGTGVSMKTAGARYTTMVVRAAQSGVQAACTASPESVEVGEEVTLDASDSENTNYVEFDKEPDGTYDAFDETDFVVTVTYEEPGTYVPEVRATGGDIEQESDTDTCGTVTVNEPPSASFTYSPSSPTVDEEVTFDASDSSDPDGEIVEYRWDFTGEGDIDRTTTDPVTTYTYSNSGGYSVGLVVADDEGATDSTTRDVSVGPNARCTASPETVEPGEAVTLDASNSSGADFVEFDKEPDGTYDASDETDFVVTVIYDEPGTYEPEVRAWTRQEQTDTDPCGTVTVGENEPPRVSLTYSPQPGVVGEEVTFDASDSSDPDGEIVEYRWDVDGDGIVDRNTTGAVTTHVYSSAGWYDMRLVAEDDDGATSMNGLDVEIREATDARCTASPRQVAPGEEVILDASNSSSAEFVEFDKEPDGTYDASDETDFIVTVTYEEPGTYEPEARIWQSEEQRDTDPCGTVTVGENEPPRASFTYSPQPGIVGDEVTFDASGSSDPDGQIIEYRWDVDGDGSVDTTTADPVTTHTYSNPDGYDVELVVADDDNATAAAGRDVLVTDDTGPEARCTATPQQVAPGEEVTIDASDSENAEAYEFDFNGDGTYDTDLLPRPTISHTYEETGEYTPRVRVYGSGPDGEILETTDTAECTPIGVRDGNEPPIARVSHAPDRPDAEATVTLNASRSTDPDGQIVEYRWDFDDDETGDRTTTVPVVDHSFGGADNYTVGLVVIDDNGATDRDTTTITVETEGAGPCVGLGGLTDPLCLGHVPIPIWLLGGAAGGVGAGYLACQRSKASRADMLHVPGGGGGGPEGIQAFAAGTFETPAGEKTVTVDGLEFEPDLLLFTVNNAVGSARAAARRTDGWSHGAAVRTPDGFAQHVVSVADDARATDAGVSATHWDKAIDVLVHGEETVGSLAGAVTGTTEDGFEVTFDDSTLPAGESGIYAVHYRAFETGDESDVQVGHFPVPEEPGSKTVPLGTDADFVSLAASTVPAGVDAAATTDRAVGISRGQAAAYPREPADQPASPEHIGEQQGTTRARTDFDVINQQVVCTSVSTDGQSSDVRGVYPDRALHLPGDPGGEPEDRTTARVTDLGTELELTFDEVTPSEGTDRPRVVTFVAVNAGEDRCPALGLVPAPGPGETADFDVGFEPELLDVTAVRIGFAGRDELVHDGVPFDYSCGVAMRGLEGTVLQQVLHPSLSPRGRPAPLDSLGSVDPLRMGTAVGRATGDDATAPDGEEDATAPDGGTPEESAVADHLQRSQQGTAQIGSIVDQITRSAKSGEAADGDSTESDEYDALLGDGSGPPAVALSLARDFDGGVTGRDEIAVASFGDSGFRLTTDGMESAHRSPATEPRTVLLYAAWPSPEGVEPPEVAAEPTDSDGDGGRRGSPVGYTHMRSRESEDRMARDVRGTTQWSFDRSAQPMTDRTVEGRTGRMGRGTAGEIVGETADEVVGASARELATGTAEETVGVDDLEEQ